MASIVPTVTAEDLHTYRSQLERINSFSERVHLDFMDGLFTSNRSIPLDRAWMPESVNVDLHLMFMRPDLYMEQILLHAPQTVIVHAESQTNLEDFGADIRASGMKFGIALLQDTSVAAIAHLVPQLDYALVFSGDLGHFGGEADLALLEKVKELKRLNETIEIGWDGGISDANARQLVDGGVDVLNVGGFIQHADDPADAYRCLFEAVS